MLQSPNHIGPMVLAGVAALLLSLISFYFIVILYYRRRIQYHKEVISMQTKFQEVLLQAQSEIQEQTFKNLSQEIHDNIGQILSLAKLHLYTMSLSNENELRQKIEDSKQLVSKAISDLRDITHSMNADFILDKGLINSIQNELDIIQKAGTIKTDLNVSGEIIDLGKHNELILFRIIQEVLNNILRHANASKINFTMSFNIEAIEIIISDNGQGMDLSPLNQNLANSGLGIRNMHNRAKMIGGDFSMQSNLGVGTEILIRIPKEKLIF